jgi:hypothetical protein
LKRFAALSLLGSLLGVAGCPSGKLSSDGAAPPDVAPLTAADFCQLWMTLGNDEIQRCYHLPPDAGVMIPPELCQQFVGSVSSGRVRFDAALVTPCLSAVNDYYKTCGSIMSPMSLDACNHIAVGQVPPGGACQANGGLAPECAGEAVCKAVGLDACGGVCVRRIGLGEPCDWQAGDACVTGADCYPAAQSKCVAKIPAGQPCGNSSPGYCETGSVCDLDVDGGATGTCRPPKSNGSPCTAWYQCPFPTSACAGPSGNRVCTAAKHNGDACTPGWGECDALTTCAADGRCKVERVAIGESCASVDGTFYRTCVADAYCNQDAKATCQAKKVPGQACVGIAGECAGATGRCNMAAHTCANCPP